MKSDFEYNEHKDCFYCPNGQPLPLKRADKTGRRFYQGEAASCAECPYQARCCESKKGAARTLTTDGKEPQRNAMREKMAQPQAKEIYKRRKTIVEPVFGQIKNGGFRGFSLRGRIKVAGEFALVCIAHNIKKIVNAARAGQVRPEVGNWVAAKG